MKNEFSLREREREREGERQRETERDRERQRETERVLLILPNPKYNEIINKYNHLGGKQMHDTDTKKTVANSYYIGSE